MTAFINDKSMIYLDTQERQIGKGQDIAISGRNLLDKNGKLCDWILVADGHGGHLTINIIKKIITDDKLAEIIATNEPMDTLVAYMKTYFIGSNSGSTCIIVKIFENNLIQSWNVGDSQVAIYVNKQLHYISCPHNMKNPAEQVRLADRIKRGRVYIEKMKEYVPIIATNTTMKTRVGEYIYFGNNQIAMTQALGDDWVTGIAPEKYEYTFDSADEVRVVAGTDGFWDHYICDGPDAEEDFIDIVSLSAYQLINKMEQRWKKDWEYIWNPKDETDIITVSYEGGYDDIGLAIWSNRMYTDPINTLNMLAIVEEVEEEKVEEEEEEEEEEVKEEVIKKSNLDTDQQDALDLWEKLNPVKVEPLWTGDGQDPEFDALANKIFEDFANKKEKEEEEEVIKKSNLDTDQQDALDLWEKLNPVKVEPLWTGDGQDPEFDALANKIFEDFANKKEKEEKEEEEEDINDMPGLITNNEIRFLDDMSLYYENIEDIEKEYIYTSSAEIKDILIHWITIKIKCMSINQKKQKLKNQSSCFQLQEFIDKEIEIVKDQLGEN
jgi:serine/threonine protein phosphatase PrpC